MSPELTTVAVIAVIAIGVVCGEIEYRRRCRRSAPEHDEHDLTQYDRKKGRLEIRLSCGRLHLFVNGFVVATEGDMCRDPDLCKVEGKYPDLEGDQWTKERMVAAMTRSAP